MPSAFLPSTELRAGLVILLQALDWASSSGFDLWDFAVEIRRLYDAGLSDTHLRWLIASGHLQHRVEFTSINGKRVFRVLEPMNFSDRSCFVLTSAGGNFARSICQDSCGVSAVSSAASESAEGPAAPELHIAKPNWNRDDRQLTCAGRLILKFSRSAPNEEAILDEFQKQAWIDRIDAPGFLMQGPNFKSRLHNAINALNRKRLAKSIRFDADGTGHGIRWSPTSPRRRAGTTKGRRRRGRVPRKKS